MSFALVNPKKCNPQVMQQQVVKDTLDNYQAADFVSMDQFVANTPGELLADYGQEGEIFVNDAAIGAIWVKI